MRRRQHQQGVALIITLILLAVITFTAVTFLILSRREKGAVVTSTSQRISEQAAQTGVVRMEAEILSTILATSNEFAYGFKVTTNYINPNGFTPQGNNNRIPANVNYDYLDDRSAFNSDNDWNQNIANLFYSPRPPVFVNTNTVRGGVPNYDFRFYLDLNRNGRFDPNGRQPVVGVNGNYLDPAGGDSGVPYQDGVLPPVGGYLTNFMVGDPEWVGVLEYPDQPHGPTNRMLARYATVVVPTGKALDLNAVHNQVLAQNGDFRDFRRNMGVGTWEMNLAAFLVDLNTNVWTAPDDPVGPNPYRYDDPWDVGLVQGGAFEDANKLIAYRYDTDFTQLRNLDALYPAVANSVLLHDFVDSYGSGDGNREFLTNIWTRRDPDNDRPGKTGVPWPGDDNPQHYFAPNDLFRFDKAAIGATPAEIAAGLTFPQRLQSAGENDSTYDRYTFYRLLSQLGTDGGFERADKINLNYDNVTPNAAGVASATNFFAWKSTNFFMEAADNLLREYLRPQLLRALGPTNFYSSRIRLSQRIPVMTNGVAGDGRTNNVFVYTPAVHRLLQLAANIYEASSTNNPTRLAQGSTNIIFPSVFKPQFAYLSGSDGSRPGVYITNWVEVDPVVGTNDAVFGPTVQVRGKPSRVLIDLEDPAVYRQIQSKGSIEPNANVYGVPWVIGVRKGLPNFNELAVQSVFEITRKLRVDKARKDVRQLFMVGVSNSVAVEAWNSYANPFPADIEIDVQNNVRTALALTNHFDGAPDRGGFITNRFLLRGGTNLAALKWSGRGPVNNPSRLAFQVPLYKATNTYPAAVISRNGTLVPFTEDSWARDAASTKGGGGGLPTAEVWLRATNYTQFVMLARDKAGRKRVIDYVHLRTVSQRDVSRELRRLGNGIDRQLWNEDRIPSSQLPRGGVLGDVLGGEIPEGVSEQILVSLGLTGRPGGIPDFIWADYGFTEGEQTKLQAIANFMAFIYERNSYYYGFTGTYNEDAEVMQVPFSPSRRIVEYRSWQANDPLVHYTPGDLTYVRQGDGVRQISLRAPIPDLEERNIWKVNDRYEPWGGEGNSRTDFNEALKDPGVRFSDDWQFPTNKFPNVGWLGRVHRGTPWQTVYMKSTDIAEEQGGRGGGLGQWAEWSGHEQEDDVMLSLPRQDRKLFDLFTAGLNRNATAGQLSVNQPGLAAWSAVLSGVITFTNPAPGKYAPFVIPPAGVRGVNSGVSEIVAGINQERNRKDNRGRPVHPGDAFEYTGDILATPELTMKSPFLNVSRPETDGLSDAVYERIPQQIMGLLRNDEPRFVIYSYGQALKPAERSLVTSGPFFGMCTNYQIMAEAATRTVVSVRDAPENPRIVVESFNVLPPDE